MKEKELARKQISFFLLFTIGCVCNFFVCSASAESVIRSATYSAQSAIRGVVRLEVDGQVLPVVSMLGGDAPRLILDFPETKYVTANTINVPGDGPVKSVRFGLHRAPLKTRVVVDLNPECTLTSPDVIVDGSLLDVQIECAPLKKKVLTSSVVEQVVQQTVDLETSVLRKDDSTLEKSVSPMETDSESVEQEASQRDVEILSIPLGEQQVAPDLVDKSRSVVLRNIVFDSSTDQGEKVLFYLNDFFPPLVSADENEGLFVYCDFHDVKITENIMNEMVPGGDFIQKITINTETNPDKVRVVLELLPGHDYDLQQIFYKKDNVFTLVITEEKAAEKTFLK